MTEPAELDALLRLMPPETESDTTVDWDRMAESWGRRFPVSYQRFIAVYGSGMIGDYLVVSMPEPWAEPITGDDNDMYGGTLFARHMWGDARQEPALQGTSPLLIRWGLDASGDNLCWDASGPDPERWPVVLWNRGVDIWRRYDCGMVEFLLRHLNGDFPECPLGDIGLFGARRAMFLTTTEYWRRLRSGMDPWTGEPDPYAGMFDYDNRP